MLETETRFRSAISAALNAISKLVRWSLCTPLPLVKNIILGTYDTGTIGVDSTYNVAQF
jgi:hypothetical protein